MVSVGMFEAKTHFSSLVDDVLSGRTDYVRVLKHGRPAVRIVIDRPVADVSRRIGVRRNARKLPSDWWRQDKLLDEAISADFYAFESGEARP